MFSSLSPKGEMVRAERWDSITLEIMWQRLLACANQASATILRTSFSTVVASSHDFRQMLTDANGDSLAQSYLGEVMFASTFPECVKHIIAAIGRDNMVPGDVYVTNDPWIGAGHLPDIHVATPIFYRERLVAFSGSVIHISDIGGRFGPHDASEVYEEGIRFPILHLCRAGELNRDVIDILRANVRTPDLAEGDVLAQIAGNAVGAKLLQEFLGEYGLDDVAELSTVLQDRVENAMRAKIAELPDGVYRHRTVAEIGIGDEEVEIISTIFIDGDELTVNYSESSPQTNLAGVNCVLNCTRSMTLFPLHAMFLANVPSNEGMARPVRIVAAPGSIMNALPPAPVDIRAMITHLLPEHLMCSLASIAPERVTAPAGIRWMLLADRVERRTGRRGITSFFQAGGLGAAMERDGANAKLFPIKAYHTPVERFELDTGIMVEEKALRNDGGGPGRMRGGLGQRIRLYNPSEDDVNFTFYRPQLRHAPPGLFEGMDGSVGTITVNGESLRTGVMRLAPGDTAVLETPCGAGFGDPLDRDPLRVWGDVQEGYVSVESARHLYGVALDDDDTRVNVAQTEALRRQLKASGARP
jgi:N-methylhydantoinase B